MLLSESASEYFQKGYNCSQSVFAAFADQLGLPVETALKIAAPFGGGMGRLGEVCGAVTGALMVLGLKYGHTSAEDATAKDRSYALAREFALRFQERHSALDCRDLLDCDLSTPEGVRQALEANLFKVRCPLFVRDAAELVASMDDFLLKFIGFHA